MGFRLMGLNMNGVCVGMNTASVHITPCRQRVVIKQCLWYTFSTGILLSTYSMSGAVLADA